MKKFIVWIAGVAVTVLTMIACTGAVSACAVMMYEPEVPAKLRAE